MIWVPGACVFSLFRNIQYKFPSSLWPRDLFSQHLSPQVAVKPCSSRRVWWAYQKRQSISGLLLEFPTPGVSRIVPSELCPFIFDVWASSISALLISLQSSFRFHNWTPFGEVSCCRRKEGCRGHGWEKSLWLVEIIKENCHFLGHKEIHFLLPKTKSERAFPLFSPVVPRDRRAVRASRKFTSPSATLVALQIQGHKILVNSTAETKPKPLNAQKSMSIIYRLKVSVQLLKLPLSSSFSADIISTVGIQPHGRITSDRGQGGSGCNISTRAGGKWQWMPNAHFLFFLKEASHCFLILMCRP